MKANKILTKTWWNSRLAQMGRFTEVASDDAPAAVAVTESFLGSFVDIAQSTFQSLQGIRLEA